MMMMFLVGVVFCHLQLISRALAVPPAVKAPSARVSHMYRKQRARPWRTESARRVDASAACARGHPAPAKGFRVEGSKCGIRVPCAVLFFLFSASPLSLSLSLSLTSSASRHWYSTSRMGRLATAASRRASIGRASPPPPPPPHRTASPVRRHRGGGRTAAPLPETNLKPPPRARCRRADSASGAQGTAAAAEDVITVGFASSWAPGVSLPCPHTAQEKVTRAQPKRVCAT